MEAPNVLVKIENSIALFTLNRPQQLNALNHQLIDDLNKELKKIKIDKNVKSLIITGSGGKAFVAGADIKEFAKFSSEEGKNLAKDGQKKLFDLIENFPKPVIAAINGFALGGGLELAMACHMRLASDNAKMGLPEVSLGVIPGYGGTQRLAQLVGKGKAMEMITTGRMIDANQALDYRLVNNVVQSEDLISTCKELALKIAKNSPNAISAAIKSINAGFSSNLNGFEVEINSFGSCFGTEDFIEGTSAFLEKRKPNFLKLSSIRKLINQTAIYGTSSIIGRFLNFLLTPLYALQFSNEQYGIITEMYAYVAFLVVFLTYGMETAFSDFQQPTRKEK